LYSQAKKPRFQTSAQPEPPPYLAAPFSKVKVHPPVHLDGFGMAEDFAEIEEVLMRGDRSVRATRSQRWMN